jgi:hypothetical protein
MGKPVVIAFKGDTHDLVDATGDVSRAVKSAADDVVKGGRRIDGALEGTAGHADNLASKGSQAAGGLSGLGDLAAQQGGVIGSLGATMMTAGIATQALADSGDLLNVVTESTIVKKGLEKVATIGSTAATIAGTAATKAATAGQWLLNAALSANPIGLIIIGLVALAAGLVIAYKKSETFRNIVNGAFHAVTGAVKPVLNVFTHGIPNAISGVVGFVKSHWKPIIAIILGPLGLVVAGVAGHIDDIKDKFNDVVGFVRDIPGRFRSLVGNFVGAGGDLIGGLVRGLSNPVGSVGPVAESIINGVVDFLNSHLPHSVSINKGPIHLSVPLFPTIPRLAGGGITTGPMLALIGDNPGGREAVIPLDKHGALGARVYNINVNVPVAADRYAAAEAIVQLIEEYESENAA